MIDDKTMVILAVTILGIMAIFFIGDAVQILTSIISGLFGVAVGRNIK